MTQPTFVHCFFEQSGTFRDQFRAMGIPAADYDIQDDYGKTDHHLDLFEEITRAYAHKRSIFDTMTKDHLIMAFFPCIYFCADSSMYFTMNHHNYRSWSHEQIFSYIIDRARIRNEFYTLLIKLIAVCDRRNLRLIIENPAQQPHYLLHPQNFLKPPSYIDRDRTRRGDFFKKPTAYWFFNCEPTYGYTISPQREVRRVEQMRKGDTAGECSKERSEISPIYARNFINDQILGREVAFSQMSIPF